MYGPTSKLRFAWCAIVLALAAVTSAEADLWYEHYARAEKALTDQDWAGAIDELNQALAKRGDSDARARTYGMRMVGYFPYLKLGIAYYHLGQLDAALNAFDTEERLGAVAESEEHLRELERARGLVTESLRRTADEQRRRAVRVAAESVEEARREEAKGRFEEAAVALGRALAVDPDNEEARDLLERVRSRIAGQEEAADRRRRQADLVEKGRRSLEAGAYSEAASVARQALDLGPNDDARALLSLAEEGLGRELESIRSAEREKLVSDRLEEARSLEAEGRYGRALERLESVLMLDPDRPDVASLLARLLSKKEEAARSAARKRSIDSLLETARDGLGAGRLEDAISAANRILALDPQHSVALDTLAASYRLLNRSLLLEVPRRNLPPAIRFAGLRSDLGSGLRAERVTSPDYVFDGIVIDESSVRIAIFHGSTDASPSAVLSEQKLGDVVLTEFSLRTRLVPGRSTFHLTATDAETQSTRSDYSVVYVRPFFRAPWFHALAVGVPLLCVGLLVWRRGRRQRRLRTRRFNPYVAGAPVLDDDLFFGRQDLLDQILGTIHKNSLLLFGERRIGKTSIQHQLRRRLRELDDPEYEFFPVYIDLQGVPEERFFRSLAEDIFEELAPHLDGLVASTYEDGADSYRLFVRDLRAVTRVLEGRSEKRPKLVLLIDEVDELNDYDPRINQRLRSLFMKSFASSIVAVVSGVEIRKRWEREASPWYNFFEELEVKPLGPEEALALVERPVRGIFKLDKGTAERILDLTACRPYLIQKLCLALVDRMHRLERRRITVADVEAAGRSALESS